MRPQTHRIRRAGAAAQIGSMAQMGAGGRAPSHELATLVGGSFDENGGYRRDSA